LILEGKSIGTLGIGTDRANQYSEADAEFLCEVAGQVALAAANMRAYEEIGALNVRVERTAERLRALLEINNAIITNLSEEALLRTIAEALRRVVPFDRAALTLTWLRRMRFGSRLSREALSPTIFDRGWRSGRQKTVWGGCSITSAHYSRRS
jgi:GAF domain-containing protein